MADRPLRIKLFSKRAAGSLAKRILFASLVLLGFPLLIHSFFLYHKEYSLSVEDAFRSLHYLAEGRAAYFEQFIESQQTLITAIESELPSDPSARKEFLKKQARKLGLDELIYVERQKDQFLCSDRICSDSTYKIFLEKAQASRSFAFINPYSKGKRYRLFVGKTLSSSALLMIATKTSRLLKKLSEMSDPQEALRLSLIDSSNRIFLSTEKELVGRKLAESTHEIEWESFDKEKNAWFLTTPEERFLSVKIPIARSEYSLLADLPEKNIQELQLQNYFFRIGSFLFIVCIVGGGGLFWITHRVAKPLRTLGRTMQQVADGEEEARFHKDSMGFEINLIGEQLNQMLDSLLKHQKEVEKERLIRERLSQELKIGHDIQLSMFPKHLPNYPTLDITSGYLAAKEVSGDFYDLFPLSDSRLLIAMADGADKGISTCLYSLSFRSMLRMAALVKKDLFSIVQTANELFLKDSVETNFFLTAWIGIYDPKTKSIEYCSQGHPPAYIRTRERQLKQLEAEGMALGIETIDPKIYRHSLYPDDLLFLYTDGITEAQNVNRQFLGKERLTNLLLQIESKDAAAFKEDLLKALHHFCEGAPLADDITFLSLIQRA